MDDMTLKKELLDLAQLEITTYVYTIWVYNNILLKKADSPENVLAELKASMEGDTLEQIGTMDMKLVDDFEGTVAPLEKKGLRYIRQYAGSRMDGLREWGLKV
jgi:hypothetical protein